MYFYIYAKWLYEIKVWAVLYCLEEVTKIPQFWITRIAFTKLLPSSSQGMSSPPPPVKPRRSPAATRLMAPPTTGSATSAPNAKRNPAGKLSFSRHVILTCLNHHIFMELLASLLLQMKQTTIRKLLGSKRYKSTWHFSYTLKKFLTFLSQYHWLHDENENLKQTYFCMPITSFGGKCSEFRERLKDFLGKTFTCSQSVLIIMFNFTTSCQFFSFINVRVCRSDLQSRFLLYLSDLIF